MNIEEVIRQIESLPQFKNGSIKDEDAQKWVDYVKNIDPSRLLWHAKRLDGWGSSDIGHLVLALREEYDPFKDAPMLVMEKLMKVFPSPENGDTKRGHYLEDMVRNEFLKYIGGKREAEILSRFSSLRVPGHDWMVGNPDDIINVDGKLILVDYKVPRPSTLEELERTETSKFVYVCQLHHLQHIAAANKIKIDGMIVASFDTNEWEIKPRVVEFNKDLMSEILEAGDKYWNEYVLKGLIPPYMIRPEFDITQFDEDAIEEFNELSVRFMTSKALEKAAIKSAEEVANKIKSITKPYKLQDSRITLPGGVVSAKTSCDKEKVFEYAKLLGLEFDAANLENSEELDTIVSELLEKIINNQEEHGLDISKLFIESHSVALTRTKKGFYSEILEREKSICSEKVSEIVFGRQIDDLVSKEPEVVLKVKRSPK